MSAINNYRSTGPEDYLNAERKARASARAGNTAQDNTPIHGLLPADSAITITTLAEVDPDTKEATSTVNVATLASCTLLTPPFKWYHTDPTSVTPPIKWGFFSWVTS